MASPSFAPELVPDHRISLTQIDAAVSARLGPTRGMGNSQPACFNRQVAMCLGKHVGRWTTTIIGRFYNGRDHSTVRHGIQRIEALRGSDPDVDALITDLKHQLGVKATDARSPAAERFDSPSLSEEELNKLADRAAAHVLAYLEKRAQGPELFAPTSDV